MTRRTAISTAVAATASHIMTAANPAAAPTLASSFVLRPAEERGKADHGWLKSAHSFSFANYFDLNHMGFEALRVINDDWVAGGGGFPMHPHKNAEIFSYVLSGSLQHRDSLGNGSTVSAGGVQYMSAGSGVTHSEFNPNSDAPVKFLQIWLMPNEDNSAPRYETMDIDPHQKDGQLRLFLSHDGRSGSMMIRSDVDIYAATLSGDQSIRHDMANSSRGWIQVANGSVTVNGQSLRRGDGLAINNSGRLIMDQTEEAEIIYFEFL